jgi:hypothetical protein
MLSHYFFAEGPRNNNENACWSFTRARVWLARNVTENDDGDFDGTMLAICLFRNAT